MPEIQLKTRNHLHGTSTEKQKGTVKNYFKRLILTVVYLAFSTEPNICVLSKFL